MNLEKLDLWLLAEHKNIEKIITARTEMIDHFDSLVLNAIKDSVRKVDDRYIVEEKREKEEPWKTANIFRSGWKKKGAQWPIICFELFGWNYECLSSSAYPSGSGGGVYIKSSDTSLRMNLCKLLRRAYNGITPFDEFKEWEGWYYYLELPNLSEIVLKTKTNESYLEDTISQEVRRVLSACDKLEYFIQKNKLLK